MSKSDEFEREVLLTVRVKISQFEGAVGDSEELVRELCSAVEMAVDDIEFWTDDEEKGYFASALEVTEAVEAKA